MKLIVIHKSSDSPSGGSNLFRAAVSREPLRSIIFGCLRGGIKYDKKHSWRRFSINGQVGNDVIAIPQDWAVEGADAERDVIYYKENLSIPSGLMNRIKADAWFVLSNGRFAAETDYKRLYKMLGRVEADVIAINIVPQLRATNEKAVITSENKLVGFRRFYDDLSLPAPIPDDWPHYLFIKGGILDKVMSDGNVPSVFSKFVNKCFSNSLSVHSINIGGTVADLETEAGLLAFLTNKLNSTKQKYFLVNNKNGKDPDKGNIKISDSARLFGRVLLGENVVIGGDAIIAGPAIISDNVKIGSGAVVKTSIIGPDISVPDNHLVQDRVFIEPRHYQEQAGRSKTGRRKTVANGGGVHRSSYLTNFRVWPRLSYAGCFKRVADIVTAIIVLVLFAPVIPVIALVIKLTSSGPVFFKDKRQGLHGRTFNCLKFRTMLVGADKVQDKLRILNQADGPQFKMSNDPRLNFVGRFLRDTYIDEVPQFFNVLLGQMSVVGPRPSPEQENVMCPSWRDARLSVRPGITGLWQVCRTRRPMKDFQEWIYYDTKYVRELSLALDLWICRQTAKKMARNFIKQF